MDIKVTLKIEGLEPLAQAISTLATAYSNSGTAAAAVIEKASKGSKPKAADPKPADTQAAAETAATTENQAPAASETAQESPSEGKPVGTAADEPQKTKETTTTEAAQESASPSSAISDEELRAAAGQAAKRDKAKVQALVAKYAPNVSAIPADVRAEFLKELETV